MRSVTGATRSAGFVGTARLVDRPRPWPSWSRWNPAGCGYFLAVVAAHAGDHRLSAVAIDGDKHLRIEYCEACRAYLKTYNGEGGESLFLADWTSLHLDVIARDRGLKRAANSLYEL
jgi:hypothetical protein